MLGTARARGGKLSLLMAITAAVCLGQFPFSDSASFAAKVTTLTGQVSVLRDSIPWALSVGDSVQVQQLIITGSDGHAQFQVSDGSTFEVYPNSRVVFRKNPGNWRDLIDLLVGRVRVHIEHLGIHPNPNRIMTPTAVISVRGTTFDVSVDDDEDSTLIEVEEGVVEVEHALLPRGTPAVLNSGESLRVYRSQPLVASVIDKGAIAKHVLRSILDALITIASRPGGVGGATSGGGGTVGDTGKTTPPPPPPPPPPPAPPPPLP
jgi:hypothetical protein